MEENTKPNLDFERKMKMDHSPIHGRGIFATEDIKEQELIEICPTVVLHHRMNYHNDPVIKDYCFTQVCPCEECKKHGGHYIMVLGYGQIYNHHDDNNAKISFNLKNSLALIIANKDIKKGEEIFISYGENYFKSRKQNESTTKKQEIKNSTTSSDNVFNPL